MIRNMLKGKLIVLAAAAALLTLCILTDGTVANRGGMACKSVGLRAETNVFVQE